MRRRARSGSAGSWDATARRFIDHPLIRKPGGAKLSKADGDSGVRELRARGLAPAAVLGDAAAAVGLIAEARPLDLGGLDALFR